MKALTQIDRNKEKYSSVTIRDSLKDFNWENISLQLGRYLEASAQDH